MINERLVKIIVEEVEQVLREAHGLNAEDLETIKAHLKSVKDERVRKVLQHVIKTNVLAKDKK